MAGRWNQAELVARCDALLARATAGGIDGAVAEAYRLPPEAPATAALAAGLVMLVLRTDPIGRRTALRHLDGLLALADRNPPPTAWWRQARSVAGVIALLCAAAEGRHVDHRTLEVLCGAAGDDPAVRILIRSARRGLGAPSTRERDRRDGIARLRGIALERLRRYASSALWKPEPAVRDAVEESLDVAHQFLVDGAPADAVTALDTGRALLQLAASGTRGAVLDPPGLAELQGALRALDVDAFVYLVPARRSAPGWAVIAPADGCASYLALTGLADVRQYQTTGPDAVRDWAWRAAIGPLLDSYQARHAGARPGRLPRLVLVPIGDLARIPWHTARRRDGTYATDLVTFSGAVSARTLCDVAAVTLRPGRVPRW